jgi:uncharacterized Fe-S cluster protein YjdI
VRGANGFPLPLAFLNQISMRKEYTNGEITVTWQPDKCIHSAICAKGLPLVFRPGEQPWIRIDADVTEIIREQVSRCPSGALSYQMNTSPKDTRMDTNPIQVRVIPDGPLLIDGSLTITHSDGRAEQRENTTALCRCGASANKPFCDGSHRTIDFRG